MMRIITGRARGVRLATLAGDATRPTAERTKEAVFSMLAFDIPDAHVLDLFSGSGQMGLEAISRGAAGAVLCDASKEAVRVIQANAEKTKLLPWCEILCSDAETVLRRMSGKRKFDLVFLDPPYAAGLLPRILTALHKGDLLATDAKVICESADAADVFGTDTILEETYEILRVARYGAACVTVLTPKEGTV